MCSYDSFEYFINYNFIFIIYYNYIIRLYRIK